MIRVQNHLGTINISQDYFTALIGNTVTSCFGVVQMNIGSARQTLMETIPLFGKKRFERGVTVRVGKDKLVIDLHITVMYGVNVGTIVKSIIHKVQYTVEQSTGIPVEKVNVYVDGIRV